MFFKQYIKTGIVILFYLISFNRIENTHAAPAQHQHSLARFINDVFSQNPTIRAAESNLFAEKAREVAAGKPIYNPNLVAQAQYANENQAFAGLSQTIDWTNKRAVRHAVGTANVDVAKAQLCLMKQTLAAEVIDALSTYKIQEKMVNLAKERVTLLKKFERLTHERFKKGDISRVDLDLAQLALSQSITQLATIEINKSLALQTLRAKTGFSKKTWPSIATPLTPLHVNDKKITELTAQYPLVLALHYTYRGARAKSKLAERQKYADPTLGLQGGTSDESGSKQMMLNLTFNLPMYIRNNYQAEADAAKFDAISSDEKYFDAVRQTKAGIRTTAERYQMLYDAMQNWYHVSKQPLSQGMVLIERLWHAGEITTMDYIMQLKIRVDSQMAGVELEGQEWHAWIEWLKSSGQILSWLIKDAT